MQELDITNKGTTTQPSPHDLSELPGIVLFPTAASRPSEADAMGADASSAFVLQDASVLGVPPVQTAAEDTASPLLPL